MNDRKLRNDPRLTHWFNESCQTPVLQAVSDDKLREAIEDGIAACGQVSGDRSIAGDPVSGRTARVLSHFRIWRLLLLAERRSLFPLPGEDAQCATLTFNAIFEILHANPSDRSSRGVAMVLESLALHHLRQRLPMVADVFLRESARRYAIWGAVDKV
jgi:hypothetical protein